MPQAAPGHNRCGGALARGLGALTGTRLQPPTLAHCPGGLNALMLPFISSGLQPQTPGHG